ncbi:DUF4136 domain-containing protein [Microbulbifer sp. SAOS-129_SWC]|uniref:DUF4136 domain-containing protein n=1 Tax=Microbulbifer sp. SAOS-129_SWC TaxID=3145235 RepID=UPI0032178788
MSASLWVALAALFTLGGCVSTPPVAVDYDAQADFSHLQSYYLLDPLATGAVSPLQVKRARRALDGLLRRRYRPADSAADADFQVRLQLLAEDKVAVYDDSLSLYGGYGFWGFGWRAPLAVHPVREDTLVLDMLAPDGQPLWHGSLPSAAAGDADPGRRQQRLHEELAQMLSRFPPRR